MTNSTNKIQTVGRRKTASARARLTKGKGIITVEGKPLEEYFAYFELQETVLAPLKVLSVEKKFDVSIKISGGGSKSQSEAARHAIARALVVENEESKPLLRANGYLTRDARVKERKKPGKRGARRGQQWKKR